MVSLEAATSVMCGKVSVVFSLWRHRHVTNHYRNEFTTNRQWITQSYYHIVGLGLKGTPTKFPK